MSAGAHTSQCISTLCSGPPHHLHRPRISQLSCHPCRTRGRGLPRLTPPLPAATGLQSLKGTSLQKGVERRVCVCVCVCASPGEGALSGACPPSPPPVEGLLASSRLGGRSQRAFWPPGCPPSRCALAAQASFQPLRPRYTWRTSAAPASSVYMVYRCRGALDVPGCRSIGCPCV